MSPRSSLLALVSIDTLCILVGCTEVPKPPPAQPPAHKHVSRGRDGRGPWSNHHDALAWLAEAKTHGKESLTFGIPLPDAGNWSFVDFIGLRTVEAWRYENHDARYHAAVAAVAYPSKNPTLEECTQRFAKTARETAKRWDFVLGETRLEEVPFMDVTHPSAQPGGIAPVPTARIYALDVVGRSLFGNKHWAAAFGVYPAWKDACFVVAVFVPVRGEFELAASLRDRLMHEGLARVHANPEMSSHALARSADID